jgi:hypothetical protein
MDKKTIRTQATNTEIINFVDPKNESLTYLPELKLKKKGA